MRLRVPCVAALLAVTLGAPSAQAAPRSWYDYYLNARDRLIPQKKYREAIASLEQAVKIKPDSALEEQTYGLEFIDYLPYYSLGLCNLRTGDLNTALQMFNIEEERGVVKRRA